MQFYALIVPAHDCHGYTVASTKKIHREVLKKMKFSLFGERENRIIYYLKISTETPDSFLPLFTLGGAKPCTMGTSSFARSDDTSERDE